MCIHYKFGTCVGSFFWKVPKSIDDKGSWAFKDGWLDWIWFSAAY